MDNTLFGDAKKETLRRNRKCGVCKIELPKGIEAYSGPFFLFSDVCCDCFEGIKNIPTETTTENNNRVTNFLRSKGAEYQGKKF